MLAAVSKGGTVLVLPSIKKWQIFHALHSKTTQRRLVPNTSTPMNVLRPKVTDVLPHYCTNVHVYG